MRRHLTYANAAATLALVFAMSGGAMAANHYLIESTKEINPKVLKKLRGSAGRTGARGATGATGATGAMGAAGGEGKQGPPGPKGTTGAVGPSAVFSTFHDPAIALADFDNGYEPVAALRELPAGSYWVVATLQATNEFEVDVLVQCKLAAGGDNDVRDFDVDSETTGTETGVMQVVHTFPTDGEEATVECDDFEDPTGISLSHIKITAMQVQQLTNRPD
jgi:Collagen triple helix repeat (20 copies)